MKTLHALSQSLLTAALLGFVATAAAQDHSQHEVPKPATPAIEPAAKPLPEPAVKMATAAKTSGEPAATTDHSAMGHDSGAMKAAPERPDASPAGQTPATTDHSAMGHDMDAIPHTPAQKMDHSAMGHAMPVPRSEPRTPIPTVTDADRAAAFPEIDPHQMQDNEIHSFVLLDRLEAWDADKGAGLEWEGLAWIGTDLDRLWLRSEGERLDGATETADLEMLYGRSVARWWDVVAGVRHDFNPGASQDFAAIGVIGLAPQKFEVEATAYLGTSGQTAFRFEIERDLLLTNRWILQPVVEVNFYGKDDPPRGIGSGLATLEGGLRLRYEFTRKFAPYIGIVRECAFGDTADRRRDEQEDSDDTRFVAGLRVWF